MAGTGVGKFSSTAGNNTDNLTVNFAENMAPSNVNNAARELMGHIRDMYEQLGDGYFEFGDGDKDYTIARVDADTLTIASSADLSAIYFAGRKIRVTDGGANVVEGTITSTSHGSSLQTVNLTGISLASGTPTKVELGIDTAAFGGKIILDDDGDTYIEAPTDDTIDIYVAGAKDFVITANTFTAESGSTIAAQALTATTLTTTGAIAIANDGNIGSAGDADAIAISSSGVVTFSQAPVFPDGSIAVADLDIDGATDIGAAIVDADLFIIDDGAGGTNRKVTASRLKTYAGATAAFTEAVTITVSDNSDTLTLISTDADANQGPILDFYRNSSSPADNDGIGQINFTGRNDNSQDVVYGQLLVSAQDVSDGTEDSVVTFSTMKAGSLVEQFGFNASEAVFNNQSNDIDFRVESDANAYQLFVDAGVPYVGISSIASANSQSVNGGDIPALQIKGTTTGTSSAMLSRHANDGNGPVFFMYKSRNATPGSNTIVQDDDQCGQITWMADDGTDGNSQVARIRADIDGTPGANDTPGRLVFMTTADGSQAATERMRIDNAGLVGIGAASSNTMLAVQTPASYTQYVVRFKAASTSAPYGILTEYSAAAPDTGADNEFFIAMDTTATRCTIFSDGDIKNHDNSYGALSDERIKQDIRDSNSQWDDIKAVKVRNFKKKDDVRQYGDNAWEQIGVIAQELETVSPKLIRKHNPNPCDILSNAEFGTLYEDGDTIPEGKEIGDVKEIKEQVKSVNYSILYMKAIKALQEAQTRIETLETKVAALEG